MYKSLIYKSFNCNLNCMEVWIINLFFSEAAPYCFKKPSEEEERASP